MGHQPNEINHNSFDTKRELSIDTIDSLPLKTKVLQIWLENKYITAKKICKKLKINYKTYGKTINTYLSLFRSQQRSGLVQKAHGVSSHKKVYYCSEKLPVNTKLEERALASGWKQSKNKNRMLIYRSSKGSVVWYRGGLILIYLKGNVPRARALEMFWIAFVFLGDKELDRLSKLFVPFSRHNVFKIGTPLPRFDIQYFKPSYGLRILCDGSHEDSVEIEESMPIFMQPFLEVLNSLRKANESSVESNKIMNDNVLLFSENMRSHLELVKELTLESKIRRVEYSKIQNKNREDRLSRKFFSFLKNFFSKF